MDSRLARAKEVEAAQATAAALLALAARLERVDERLAAIEAGLKAALHRKGA